MKPKRCEKLWPFSGPIPSGERKRCTLEAGHAGLHTIIPPSGMNYAPDDEPRFTIDDGVSYCDRHHRFDCPECAEIDGLVAEIETLKMTVTVTEYAWRELAEAAKEYMEAEGAGGTFDAGRVRETRARLKELTEIPE